MIRAGIIGGATQQAGELLRLLINHPDVELEWVHAPAQSGNLLTDFHRGMTGETFMRFIDKPALDEIDILFCCTPSAETNTFFEENEIDEDLKIIVFSDDHNQKDYANEEITDGQPLVYGFPEHNRKPLVRGAKYVANPGNIATPVLLALYPLAKNNRLFGDINATVITAASADFAKPTSRPADSISVYKPLRHPQLEEITTALREIQPDFEDDLLLVTIRGAFARGTIAVMHLETDLELEQIRALYEEAYIDHSFTFVLDRQPDLKDVINTNKCLIYLDKIGSRLVVTAVTDNMIKGSAGNAVHIMNLLFGLSERTGLYLKSSSI